MLDKSIVSHPTNNGQKSIKARQFALAFVPSQTQQNTARLWAEKLSEARRALTDFSSACHRWQATGRIDPAELIEQVEALDTIGLADFTDELISLATVANCGGDL